MAKVQKGAADAAARLIAKYGKAAVTSAIRNFKPAAKVKVTPIKGTGNARQYPKSNVKSSQSKFTGVSKREGIGPRERARLSTPSSKREEMALKYAKEQSNIRKAKKK
jgi:hypothetical protein